MGGACCTWVGQASFYLTKGAYLPKDKVDFDLGHVVAFPFLGTDDEESQDWSGRFQRLVQGRMIMNPQVCPKPH